MELRNRITRQLMAVLVLFYCVLLTAGTKATSVSEGYKTSDTGLTVGMAVSLSPESSSENKIVERASTGNKDHFVGVVTTLDANLLTLNDKNTAVFVATLGETTAYVSDINGEINKGDFITVSPLKGIGMRASADESMVMGTTLEDFDPNSAKPQEVSGKDGSKRTVLVDEMRIELNPRNVTRSNKDTTFLLIFGRSLTGRPVNQAQVIVALVIFFFLLVVEGSIVYGAIYSSITALGRNPLARSAVYKQLFQVTWVAIVVLAFGLAAIYAVLWV